jgi:hypothetical protein
MSRLSSESDARQATLARRRRRARPGLPGRARGRGRAPVSRPRSTTLRRSSRHRCEQRVERAADFLRPHVQWPLQEGDHLLPPLEAKPRAAEVLHAQGRVAEHVVGVVVPLDVYRAVESFTGWGPVYGPSGRARQGPGAGSGTGTPAGTRALVFLARLTRGRPRRDPLRPGRRRCTSSPRRTSPCGGASRWRWCRPCASPSSRRGGRSRSTRRWD